MPLSEALAARRHANRPWWRRASQSIEQRVPPALRGRWALSLPAATAVALVALTAAGVGGWYLTRSQGTVVDIGGAGAGAGGGGGGGNAGDAAASLTPTSDEAHATQSTDSTGKPLAAGRDAACHPKQSSDGTSAAPASWTTRTHALKTAGWAVPVAGAVARGIAKAAEGRWTVVEQGALPFGLSKTAGSVPVAGAVARVHAKAAEGRWPVAGHGTLPFGLSKAAGWAVPVVEAVAGADAKAAERWWAVAGHSVVLPIGLSQARDQQLGGAAAVKVASRRMAPARVRNLSGAVAEEVAPWRLSQVRVQNLGSTAAVEVASRRVAPARVRNLSGAVAEEVAPWRLAPVWLPAPAPAPGRSPVTSAGSPPKSAPAARPNTPAVPLMARWYQAPITHRYAEATVNHRACPPRSATAATVPALTSPAAVGAAAVVVDIEGKVAHPGVQTLPAGSRVYEALAAAGGALPGVDVTGLDLARPVADGEQLRVGIVGGPNPVVGLPEPSGGGGARGKHGKPSQPVNLNTASLDQLESLPDVGPALAQRILDWRAEHGRFTSVAQLQQVRGIGQRKFADMQDSATV